MRRYNIQISQHLPKFHCFINIFYHVTVSIYRSYIFKKTRKNCSAISDDQKWMRLHIVHFIIFLQEKTDMNFASQLTQSITLDVEILTVSYSQHHTREIRELSDGPRVNISGGILQVGWPRARRTWRAYVRSVRYRGIRSQFCAAESGQYAPGPARSWIAALWCEPHRPRWSCARWAARTALRRRPRNSCRSATTHPSTRAISSSMRCRRRWSIATGALRADDCSARPHKWISIFPIAITPRLVLDSPRRESWLSIFPPFGEELNDPGAAPSRNRQCLLHKFASDASQESRDSRMALMIRQRGRGCWEFACLRIEKIALRKCRRNFKDSYLVLLLVFQLKNW